MGTEQVELGMFWRPKDVAEGELVFLKGGHLFPRDKSELQYIQCSAHNFLISGNSGSGYILKWKRSYVSSFSMSQDSCESTVTQKGGTAQEQSDEQGVGNSSSAISR